MKIYEKKLAIQHLIIYYLKMKINNQFLSILMVFIALSLHANANESLLQFLNQSDTFKSNSLSSGSAYSQQHPTQTQYNHQFEDEEKEITFDDLSTIEKMYYDYALVHEPIEEDISTESISLDEDQTSLDQTKKETQNLAHYQPPHNMANINAYSPKPMIPSSYMSPYPQQPFSHFETTPITKKDITEQKIKKELIVYQFGYDIFNDFNPLTNSTYQQYIPVNDDYILGPGDSLMIRIWGKIEESFEETIDKNGNLYLPKVGYLTLSGTSFTDAKEIIKKSFEKYYVNIDFSITMGQLKTIKVFVLGNAKQPGGYDISSMSTLMNALYAAGGPTKEGSLRKIELRRKNKTIQTIDLYDYLLNGDNKQDPLLKANDTIYIPPIGPVTKVDGGVTKAGIFEIKQSDTLYTAIETFSGGLAPNANIGYIKLERNAQNGARSIFDYQLTNSTFKTTLSSQRVKNGDWVSISKGTIEQLNGVTVEGYIYHPGTYEISDSLTLSSLVKKAGGLKENALSTAIQILRMNGNYKRHIVFANLEETPDFKLKNKDKITIISYEDFYGKQTITVEGAVKEPGQFEFYEDIKIRDLLILAKIDPNAELSNTEIFRNSGDNNQTLFTININDIITDPTHQDNITLEPNDIVTVRYKANVTTFKRVYLSGEVKYPGIYLARQDEHLSSVLERAGGFTQDAFLKGALFKRREAQTQEKSGYTKILDDEKKRIIFDQRRGNLTTQAQQIYQSGIDFIHEQIDEAEGRIILNLSPLTDFKTSNDNITLEDGDELFIPTIPNSVQVVGGIEHPTAILFEQKKSPQFYINQSGGLTEFAKKRKVYVFKPNGSISINPNKVELGDTIYIPEEIKIKTNWIDVLSKTADLLFKTISALVLVNELKS